MPTPTYNQAFFTALAASFLEYKALHGEEGAYAFLERVMRRNLGAAYDAMNAKRDGGPGEFERVVGARDASVGLEVSFAPASSSDFTYAFLTDPFPMLKGQCDGRTLFDTFMKFKVERLLGPGWTHEYVAHAWDGASATEIRIFKRH